MLLETGWYGYTQVASGNIRETIGSNGAPSARCRCTRRRRLRSAASATARTATCSASTKVNTNDFVRHRPVDRQAGRRSTSACATTTTTCSRPTRRSSRTRSRRGVDRIAAHDPFSETALREVELVRAAPRHDLRPDGHRQDRAEVELRHVPVQPGRRRRGEREPEPGDQERHLRVDRHEGLRGLHPRRQDSTSRAKRARSTASALAGTITVDPNIKQPYSHQATAYVEQQLTEGVGARVGFVYYTVKNQTGTFQPLRPASRVHGAVQRRRPGPDGITGNADDQNLTAYGIPTANGRRPSRRTRSSRTRRTTAPTRRSSSR